ncbi:MAG: hypothetical protein AMK73_03850 [Planctomycetes bacterium SM23_32]|nr:MAG: hypothetical protein AMK73_03850 [Planctomycetes bacterium SM23_32]
MAARRGGTTVKTEVGLDGTKFLINGRPTYEGVTWRGQSVEGLLLNSRMIQAIFDDANPETRKWWAYPDTGEWDPDRNTGEFCAALPEYRRHGLLAVTVGLQGGGSVYIPEVYNEYVNSAYEPDGTFKPPYFDRLLRVIRAADEVGMVVIVNYFYVKHAPRLEGDDVLLDVTRRVTEWLLRTGYCNILVDVANEAADWWPLELMQPAGVHRLIEAAREVTVDGGRLLVSSSSGGGMDEYAKGAWLAAEDFTMPHGNGRTPEQLKEKIRRLCAEPEYRERPRPVCINEDSIFVENLEAAVEEGASWGFYCQGYGSEYQDRMNWKVHGREETCDRLSGYQTLPVNWGINTDIKRAFFDKVKEITGGS